ncbi:MAG: hypothetical protein Ta2D_00470 [Rickettsiales bacterium]|nr:MAG: hypothetical protein Ta2D_00470 [Rickettsiales bacterium]
MNSFKNTLYYADNLDILKKLSRDVDFYAQTGGGIDLIYIDPPFNSNRDYNILYKDSLKDKKTESEKKNASITAFEDTWSNIDLSHELQELEKYTETKRLYEYLKFNFEKEIFDNSQMSYLTMMAHRLYYMHKLLKDTGSLYLHCDPTMSHHLKILCDIVFGVTSFKNEIIWSYKRWTAVSYRFQKMHDVILFYTKSKDKDGFTFNTQYSEYQETTMKNHPWELDENGLEFYWKKGKDIEPYKIYKNEEGVKMSDVWDLPQISPIGKERLGYPTQKPETLLERIIKASSKEGDLVADFFCGCGTSISVAEKLNRKWLGVDISHLAISLIENKRFKIIEQETNKKIDYEIIGFPKDIEMAEKLANDDKFKFEKWIVEYVFNGHQTKKTGDGGYDGDISYSFHNSGKPITLSSIIEVKGGNVNISQIRAFKDTIQNKSDFGIFCAFNKYITAGMREEADRFGYIELSDDKQNKIDLTFKKPKKMYIITIEELLANDLPLELVQMSSNITY